MGSYVKDYETYRKLSNEAQHNFGKLKPIGKFLNDNARISIEVIDDETLRITYCSIVYYSSKHMLSIINEVESKTARKAAEDVCKRLEEKLDVKIKLREDNLNDYAEFIQREPETSERHAYYRWSVLADVDTGEEKKVHLLEPNKKDKSKK